MTQNGIIDACGLTHPQGYPVYNAILSLPFVNSIRVYLLGAVDVHRSSITVAAREMKAVKL